MAPTSGTLLEVNSWPSQARGKTARPIIEGVTRMMSDRMPCCVPFCRRTTKAGRFSEWICGKHWPLVSPEARGAYNLVKRRARWIIARRPIYREYWKLRPGSPERLRAVSMWRRIDAAWARCKREAIERAAGI